MPIVNIKYDDVKVTDEEIVSLSHALKKIIADATNIPEVFVYADSPKIKIEVDPIEVFIEMSIGAISDRESLFKKIRDQLSDWKKANNFGYPVTVTLIPMDWKFEVGI